MKGTHHPACKPEDRPDLPYPVPGLQSVKKKHTSDEQTLKYTRQYEGVYILVPIILNMLTCNKNDDRTLFFCW